MRCPKCGFISFDYVNNCEKCGKDLAETAAMLGPFLTPASVESWFEVSETNDVEPQVDTGFLEPEPDTASVDLGNIDVSDLVSDEVSADAVVEEVTVLDSDIIETVAVDEDFQKALDDVITE